MIINGLCTTNENIIVEEATDENKVDDMVVNDTAMVVKVVSDRSPKSVSVDVSMTVSDLTVLGDNNMNDP